MKQLNWHTADVYAVINGVQITPEAWVGESLRSASMGVIDYGGTYCYAYHPTPYRDYLDVDRDPEPDEMGYHNGNVLYSGNVHPSECHPVYPPVGFGGMSEAEIWQKMWRFYGEHHIGISETYSECIILSREWDFGGHVVSVNQDGNPAFFACGREEDYGCISPAIYTPDEMRTFITALQNTQVLSARIKEGQRE